MRFTINIEKKNLYLLIGFLFIFAGTLFVLAYGTNNPANFGHTYQEIDGLPDPRTIWTSNNDGPNSGLDADKVDGKHDGELNANLIDSQDVQFKDLGTATPKICINQGTCGTTQQQCQGRTILNIHMQLCNLNSCVSRCQTACLQASCSWSCNGGSGTCPGNIVAGSQTCTAYVSNSADCDDQGTIEYCTCSCSSPGQSYTQGTMTQRLYCANLNIA